MEIVHPEIENYLSLLAKSSDPVLQEMEGRAGDEDFPIVGPLVGRLLRQLAETSAARRVLELGSGFGYSAYWFAQGLEKESQLILTDWSKENLLQAERYLKRGGQPVALSFLEGDALETLQGLKGDFDIIFNDTQKSRYPEVVPLAAHRLRPGGLLISDNVLWHGRVVAPEPDPDTQAVLEYNRLIFNDPGLFSVILPLRDGVAVSRRL